MAKPGACAREQKSFTPKHGPNKGKRISFKSQVGGVKRGPRSHGVCRPAPLSTEQVGWRKRFVRAAKNCAGVGKINPSTHKVDPKRRACMRHELTQR